jgi:peptidyl-prolyl cis-trans isomerase C
MKSYLRNLTWIVVFFAVFFIGCEPQRSAEVVQPTALVAPQPEAAKPQPATELQPAVKAEPVPEKVEQEPNLQQQPRTEVQPSSPAEVVAVTVNGFDITEKDIEERIKPRLEQMAARNKQLPPAFIEQLKTQMRKEALEQMIVERLVDEQVKAAQIVVTAEDVNNLIQKMAAAEKLSVEDMKALVEASGQSFERWKQQMQFEKRLAYQKLFESKFNSEVNVTEEDARQYYSENQQQFDIPEQVRASHILIKPDTSDPNVEPALAKAAAKAKAEKLLKQIKDGADFSELAKANSDCPSSVRGGDLGYFSRGRMVPAFEEAAFALGVGRASDIVETNFGYHIIKVTDKKEAATKTFEEVRNDLVAMLTAKRQGELAEQYIESLKAEANIVYPPGKEPNELMPPPRPAGSTSGGTLRED